MAEPCSVAFGRYIRTLRERRGLSLDDVGSLSKTFPEPIGKSYLSRCENGRQKLGFAKMIALSRIFDVPSEVLLERMELDLELDRVGGPDTEGATFEELENRGKDASDHGRLWDTYAYFREGLTVISTSPLMYGLEDRSDQIFWGHLNYNSAVGLLGRSRLALHELRYLISAGWLSHRLAPLLHERMASWLRSLGDLDEATRHADEAIEGLQTSKLTTYLGYAFTTRALVASDLKQYDPAIAFLKQAFASHRQANQENPRIVTLLNIAGTYFAAGRVNAARRAASSCLKTATHLQRARTRTLASILLGLIEESDGNIARAVLLWRAAVDSAKKLGDRVTQFQAEFYLFREAYRRRDHTTSTALARRLRRLMLWIPVGFEELEEFRRLSAIESGFIDRERVS